MCVANAFISPFNTQNLMPWRDSNPGLPVPEADAMSTAPRLQDKAFLHCSAVAKT
jgi:hypothetical protein